MVLSVVEDAVVAVQAIARAVEVMEYAGGVQNTAAASQETLAGKHVLVHGRIAVTEDRPVENGGEVGGIEGAEVGVVVGARIPRNEEDIQEFTQDNMLQAFDIYLKEIKKSSIMTPCIFKYIQLLWVYNLLLFIHLFM